MAPLLPGRTRAAIRTRAQKFGLHREYEIPPAPKEPVPYFAYHRKRKR